MRRERELTDEQWAALAPHLPPQRPATGRPAKEHRLVVEAVLWRLRTGAPWRDLPERYGPWQSAYTRFRRWQRAGVWGREVGAILRGERKPTRETLEGLVRAVPRLEAVERERPDHKRTVLNAVRARCRAVTVRRFAGLAGVHYPHLTEVLAGRRRPSEAMLTKLEAMLVAESIELGAGRLGLNKGADDCSD